MLYAKVCSCVHTYTKATYDVHAVFSVHVCIYIWCTRHFSVHVCHSHMDRIICSLLCDRLFPLYFQVFILGVYKQYTQFMSIAIAWNFTGIWHTGTWLPGCWTFHQIYIRYILHMDGNSDILISYGWYSEVYSSHCFSLLYDCTLMSTHFYCIYSCTPCTHCVDIVALVLRLWNVYIWYINSIHLSTKRYIVYWKMKPDVSFSRLHIRPSHIYAFSNITFSYCPSRLRMLASG